MGVSSLIPERVSFRNWPLYETVAERQGLVVEIVFELVTVQPVLPDIHPRILEKGRFVGSEPVSNVAAPHTRQSRPNYREHPDEGASYEWILVMSSSLDVSGALDVIETLFQDRSCESRYLSRIVFPISGHYNNELVPVRQSIRVPLSNRMPDPLPNWVFNNSYRNVDRFPSFIYLLQNTGNWIVDHEAYLIHYRRFEL